MLSTRADGEPIPREHLVAMARALPADLRILSKLGEILNDLNSELSDIASLLRTDVVLAAKVVKIGNSAAYAGAGSVSSVEDAVNRVGFGEILRLVGIATAARLSDSMLHCYGINSRLLRDNMLYGAFAAESLARYSGVNARVAYTAGLLRSIGIMVLDRVGRNRAPGPPVFASPPWTDFAEWEISVFGITSAEATAHILSAWQFPVEVTEAIRAHHLAQPADREQPLAALLNVANGLAQRVGRGFPGENCHFEITPDKLRLVGLKDEDFEHAIVATEQAFDAASAALEGAAPDGSSRPPV